MNARLLLLGAIVGALFTAQIQGRGVHGAVFFLFWFALGWFGMDAYRWLRRLHVGGTAGKTVATRHALVGPCVCHACLGVSATARDTTADVKRD